MAYQTVNPTTNELVKTYPNHTDADIAAALDATHKLYKSEWSKGPVCCCLNGRGRSFLRAPRRV